MDGSKSLRRVLYALGEGPSGCAFTVVACANRRRLSSAALDHPVTDLSATVSLRPTRIALLVRAVGPRFDPQVHADLRLSLGRRLQPDHSRVSQSTPGLAPPTFRTRSQGHRSVAATSSSTNRTYSWKRNRTSLRGSALLRFELRLVSVVL